MRLCVYELPHVFGSVSAQLALLDQMPTRPGDLVLLPELALTGYVSPTGSFDVSSFAEPLDGPTSSLLARFADARDITLCWPLVREGGFNTLVVHKKGHYDKVHPWYPETWATPGARYLSFDLNGLRFVTAICFDVHFLHDEAADLLQEADWLLFPSAWVEDDVEQRQHLLETIARAYDIGVVNANWGRGIPHVATQGRSLILNKTGVLAETDRARPGPQWISYRTEDGHVDKT